MSNRKCEGKSQFLKIHHVVKEEQIGRENPQNMKNGI